ncbi:MAG: selenobiotic family peptide radical SAM maturase [Nitrospirae bacterium]|nr:selenobiotic family peptide radical SAM maturase [Nitrospirota bacterium]
MTIDTTNNVYPVSRSAVGEVLWDRNFKSTDAVLAPDALFRSLNAAGVALPGFLHDLLRIEHALWLVGGRASSIPPSVDELAVNPTIAVHEVDWRGLCGLIEPVPRPAARPVEGSERILLWFDPRERKAHIKPASNDDLLVLKIAAERISPESVAATGKVTVSAVDALIDRAVRQGLLLAPLSLLRRDPSVFRAVRPSDEEFLSSDSFTLQWHITQVCDLNCKHCYDRSDRSPLSLGQAVMVLDDLRAFCKDRRVRGAISFTGGNPLLHPQFNEIYRAAADRGFGTAILGNPAPRERIEEIVRIQMPSFFQVSLEGLREHNDSIRGAGHFDRIMAFLDILRSLGVYSMVMLTLTRDNMDEVIPLSALLRGKADVFHFNRLALFGEGANLKLPDRKRYRKFLEDYLAAGETNPVMGIKDNLINILRREKGIDLFGGCAGYGCGAAFNFVSLLADGEVHACRKLPSPIGNLHRQNLAAVYDSEAARRYRLGPSACRDCEVRPACGGCLASTLSSGLNIFENKDPFCFKQEPVAKSQHPEGIR